MKLLDEIEFKNYTTERDVLKYYQEKMFRSKWFYIYFAALFAVLTIYSLKSRISLEDYVGLLFLAGIISFACMAFKGERRYKLFYLPESKKITFVNDEGFGTRTDGKEVLYKWKMITSIEETDNYIVFHCKRRCRIFFKKYLPVEVISRLRDILRTVPVKNISLDLQVKQ